MLSVLSLKSNGMGTKEAGEVLGEMLGVNSVLKELDLSDNYTLGGDAAAFALGISKGLSNNNTLTKLGLQDNKIPSQEATELERKCAARGVALVLMGVLCWV
jgi:hypothetical protein